MQGRVRIYSVSEANALLPRLAALTTRARGQLDQIEHVVARLRQRVGERAAAEIHDRADDPTDVRWIKSQLREHIALLRSSIEAVDATGAVLKDIRSGLVDFYGKRNATLVWLCWRTGEPSVAHWHPLDRGFSERRPLGERAIDPMLN